jgi:hypothetical protein
MASRGASVIVVGQTFRDAGVPGIEFMQADLSLMREAKRVRRSMGRASVTGLRFRLLGSWMTV